MSQNKPILLDCTLRDGSYVIDFQFTETDTRQIGEALDQAGFSYIEVGHGIGLGASGAGQHVAAASDKDYMSAASESIKNGKWGMFCIPGIATLDHVKLAADHGMGFIRIGTDVTKVDSAEPFVQMAKNLGIEVYANFMKSYVLPPREFGLLVKRAAGFGAEIVYLVDSAGGMLPQEVKDYVRAAKDIAPDVELGFHGHNNLGLGVANSLVCLEEGVHMIDVSLQGFGRSGGNVPTEQLICVLQRLGYELEIAPLEIMRLGESLIRPLIVQRGISSLDTVSGLALFHSSYMPAVLKEAKHHRVDPRALIIELCEQDRINAPKDLIEKLASHIKSSHSAPGVLPWATYYGEEQDML